MKHKNSHLLVGYWSRLRKGRDVPDQSEIDPRAIKRMLSQVFILDASSITRPLYRLAGTTLCEKFGQELRGTNFLTHWEPDSSASLASLLAQSLRLKQPVCLLAVGATSDNGMVEIETVLAPLSYGNGGAVRFIGMMQVLGDASPLIGRAIAFERLVGAQLIREDEPTADFDVMPPPSFPHPDQRRGSHLRLVVDREKPTTVHYETEHVMRRVMDAFGARAVGDSKLVS